MCSDSFSIFGGKPLPWTSKQVKNLDNSLQREDPKNAKRGVAGRQLSSDELRRRQANLAKVVDSTKNKVSAGAEEEPKKKKGGLFGLF